MKTSKIKPVVESSVSNPTQPIAPSETDLAESDLVKNTLLAKSELETELSSDGDVDASTLPEPSGILIEASQAPTFSAADADCASGKEASCPPWRVFTSTFITIFLAELGDKTQISTLLMSAEFHKPWIVFAGAGSALVTTSLLGVLVGQWLSTRLSPRTLDVSAGIMLALISVWLIWDVVHL